MHVSIIERSRLKEHAELIDLSTFFTLDISDKGSNYKTSGNIEPNSTLLELLHKIYIESNL